MIVLVFRENDFLSNRGGGGILRKDATRSSMFQVLICCPSLSSSGIKTGNRRIMHHNFLRLVFRRFRQTKCSHNTLSVARLYTGKWDR